MEEIILNSVDNYKLCLHLFEVENPKGYIQILHGMEEHQERYEYFISKLNDAGYTVLSSDMRGHGHTAPLLGYFKDHKGYNYVLEDYKLINKYYRERFNQERVIMFAHSMGTIILRNLMQTESKYYEDVILSGYPCYQVGTSFGIFLANTLQLFKGPKKYSKFLNNLSVGSFNKKIKNPRTNLDWLSVNEENVDKYMENELCGFGFKISALNDLFHLVKFMHNPKRYKNINNMPILMIRGKDDPCTGYDKGANDSIKTLKKAGFTNISNIEYKNNRHEILNEDTKDKVIEDIIEHLKK